MRSLTSSMTCAICWPRPPRHVPATGAEGAPVHPHRLHRQQVRRDTVGGKGVDEQDIEAGGRLVAKRKQTLSPRDLQTALRAIAARIGWPAVTELSEESATDLCERWSRDEVTDDELDALKTGIEQALALRPRAATA